MDAALRVDPFRVHRDTPSGSLWAPLHPSTPTSPSNPVRDAQQPWHDSDGILHGPCEVEELKASLQRALHPLEWSAESACRLGTREKSVENTREARSIDEFVFSSALAERRKWRELLPQIDDDPWRVARFMDCGQNPWVVYDCDKHRYSVHSKRCKMRVCPRCRKALQQKAARRIKHHVGTIEHHQWQFITLTMRHTTRSLEHQIHQVRNSFRKLRQRAIWKRAVAGGYAVLEIGYNSTRDEWHPHLHVLAKTPWIDWSELRRAWKRVTHGSDAIDCRWVSSEREAINYVAKYVGKPPDSVVLDHPDRAAEYYHALRSARLLLPFGACKLKTPSEDADRKPRNLVHIAELRDVLDLAQRGNLRAIELVSRLEHGENEPDDPPEPQLALRFHDPGESHAA